MPYPHTQATADPLPTCSDSDALDRLAELVGSNEWNADLMEPVMGLIRSTGRPILDLDDRDARAEEGAHDR